MYASSETTIAAPLVRPNRRPRRAPENLAEALAPLDRRTRFGRALAEFRAGLIRHAGGAPSETQSALIEVACQLKARLAVMDAEFNGSGAMSAHAGRTYLAWSNSLTRTLKTLGIKGAAAQAPSLASYLASKGAAPSAGASG